MGVFSRIGEIVNANINAMLDKAENPEKMVKLMIAEMEDTLIDIKSSAAEVVAERIRTQRSLSLHQNQVLEWQNKAELAITKQRDDLAKEAIEQKLSCEEHVAELTRRVTELTGMIEQYQSDVARLEEKLDSAKRRQKTIIATHKQAVNRRKVEDKIYQINTSGAFNRFEQYQQKIDRYNAEAEVTAVANQSLEKKFKDLESENRVEAELARMKAVHTAAAPPEPPADASSESQSS